MVTPIAIEIYLQYLNGKSAQDLSREYRLPVRCIQTRLDAATVYISKRSSRPHPQRRLPAAVKSLTVQ